MARSCTHHVTLCYLTPVQGRLIWTLARFQFCPTGDPDTWGVLLDGVPMGTVWRDGALWGPADMTPWLPTRLAAATRLVGAFRYSHHPARRDAAARAAVARHMPGGTVPGVHDVRRTLGLAA